MGGEIRMRERREYLLPNGHEIRHAFPGRKRTSNSEIAENEFGVLNSLEIGRPIRRRRQMTDLGGEEEEQE